MVGTAQHTSTSVGTPLIMGTPMITIGFNQSAFELELETVIKLDSVLA